MLGLCLRKDSTANLLLAGLIDDIEYIFMIEWL